MDVVLCDQQCRFLGCPELGQRKAGIHACIAIYKRDEDRFTEKNSQKAIAKVMSYEKNSQSLQKRKQVVLEELLITPRNPVESALISSNKSRFKEMDEKLVTFFYENCVAFTVANLSSSTVQRS